MNVGTVPTPNPTPNCVFFGGHVTWFKLWLCCNSLVNYSCTIWRVCRSKLQVCLLLYIEINVDDHWKSPSRKRYQIIFAEVSSTLWIKKAGRSMKIKENFTTRMSLHFLICISSSQAMSESSLGILFTLSVVMICMGQSYFSYKC